MADTGAPFNLPFPLPTDLVRDGADAIKDLAEATALAISDASVIRQVFGVSDNTPFTTTSGNYVAVPNLEVTITPEDESSRILVLASVGAGYFDSNDLRSVAVSVFRGDTNLALPAGDREPAFSSTRLRMDRTVSGHAMVFLDEPTATFPVTYNVRVVRSATTGVVYVDAGEIDTNASSITRTTSSLIVAEVAP